MARSKAEIKSATDEVWGWVQEGRAAFLAGKTMPYDQTAESLARQMGWRSEKVQHDSMVGIFVVREALESIDRRRSLGDRICSFGRSIRWRAYAVWYWMRGKSRHDEDESYL